MAPRFGASMMMLVGQIGPKLFLPVGIILSKNDVIITDFFRAGCEAMTKFHASTSAPGKLPGVPSRSARSSLLFGPISSDEQTRNHDDLLLRRFESGGKLGFFRCHEPNRRKPGLEGRLCFFALSCRPVDQRSPLCASDPFKESFIDQRWAWE